MDDREAALVLSETAIEERLLLDYGVDTAKLMVTVFLNGDTCLSFCNWTFAP